MYVERAERGDSCRMHAIHALLGRRVWANWEAFCVGACDAYDAMAGLEAGTSRHVTTRDQLQFALNAADASEQFALLAVFAWDTAARAAAVALLEGFATNPCSAPRGLVGLLACAHDHVWAVVQSTDGRWWSLDSNVGAAVPTTVRALPSFYIVVGLL